MKIYRQLLTPSQIIQNQFERSIKRNQPANNQKTRQQPLTKWTETIKKSVLLQILERLKQIILSTNS